MTTTKSRRQRMLAKAQARKTTAAAEAAAKAAAEAAAKAAHNEVCADEAVDCAVELFEDALNEANEALGAIGVIAKANSVAAFIENGAEFRPGPDPALVSRIEILNGELSAKNAELTAANQALNDAKDPDKKGSLAKRLKDAEETNGNLQADLNKAKADLDPAKDGSTAWKLKKAEDDLLYQQDDTEPGSLAGQLKQANADLLFQRDDTKLNSLAGQLKTAKNKLKAIQDEVDLIPQIDLTKMMGSKRVIVPVGDAKVTNERMNKIVEILNR